MATKEQQARLAQLEANAGAREHVGVIIVQPGEDVAALIARAEAEGRIAPAYGVLVLPADVDSADEWERQARAYFAG